MLSVTEVQAKLKSIGYQKPFTVVFIKKNGETRKLHGFLQHDSASPLCGSEKPQGEPKSLSAIPVCEIESGQWRSFRTDSVVEILEDC